MKRIYECIGGSRHGTRLAIDHTKRKVRALSLPSPDKEREVELYEIVKVPARQDIFLVHRPK